MQLANEKILEYKFRFVFANGSEKTLTLKIDAETLELIRQSDEPLPEWSKHKNFQCSHEDCNTFHPIYCPIAVNLHDVIKFFSDIPSYERVTIHADVNGRSYTKETTIQDGAGSIIGIVMPTSGCPVLNKLKPLVRFHLPFASIEETEFRVFSMYLLAQYLRSRKGKTPDWKLTELKDMYEKIQSINQNVAAKIADMEKMDTSINAVVILSNFAHSVTFDLEDDDLSGLEKLFKEWIDD